VPSFAVFMLLVADLKLLLELHENNYDLPDFQKYKNPIIYMNHFVTKNEKSISEVVQFIVLQSWAGSQHTGIGRGAMSADVFLRCHALFVVLCKEISYYG
jgi:hypothetical protein